MRIDLRRTGRLLGQDGEVDHPGRVEQAGARKLIETAFPVEQVGRHASREKSIRHGHPSTAHLWWSRKPLAAARAVLFAQLVDDPGARPDRFPTVPQQEAERVRLLDLVGRMSAWEVTADPVLMGQVRAELRTAGVDPERLLIWDPFAGGGSIPLEGQRLGLPVLAGDLNPVAVLLERALLQLPRRWRGRHPVSASAPAQTGIRATSLSAGDADRAVGLATDLRFFGERVLAGAAHRLRPLYPPVVWGGAEHPVAAYLWVRTVPCADPTCGATVPMLSNPWLDRRAGRSRWLEPTWHDGVLGFRVVDDDRAVVRDGRGAVFGCLACGRVTVPDDVKGVATDQGLGRALRCVVPDAGRDRPFLVLPEERVSPPVPVGLLADGLEVDLSLPLDPAVSNAPTYGIRTLGDLHLPRQRAAMAVFAAQVRAARSEVAAAAEAAGWPADDCAAYAADVTLLLGLVLGRLANRMSTACVWNAHRGLVEQTFIQNNAIAFPWDFAEANPLSTASGSWPSQLDWVARVVARCDPAAEATVVLADARTAPTTAAGQQVVVSTDPPYFDYFLYSSLSDYFYAWLRPALAEVAPDLFAGSATPKVEEIVARPVVGSAVGGSVAEGSVAEGSVPAGGAFVAGLAEALTCLAAAASAEYPITIYYAYKSTVGAGAAQAWVSFLGAVQSAGLVVTATWPIRTERTEGVKTGRNSLASSIVVVCRPRDPDAGPMDLETFLAELRRTVPGALDLLQASGIAPVDLDQAALGQGMAVYTAASRVAGRDGAALPLGDALGLVDRVVGEALLGQRARLDPVSRVCLQWFEWYGFRAGPVSRWRETVAAVDPMLVDPMMVDPAPIAGRVAGLVAVEGGRVRLLAPEELAGAAVESHWGVVLGLAGTLRQQGFEDARSLAARMAGRVDLAVCHPLVFVLYRLCDRRNQPRPAGPFNALGTVWRDLVRDLPSPG